jgi:hypothetical protein
MMITKRSQFKQQQAQAWQLHFSDCDICIVERSGPLRIMS